ncbi:hypothetical protein BK742_24080 [Bacillus thuringiensis serovar pingluonsis]|uniref:DUF4046 domain-containing protein n=1 Tax=Bacillus thuringiensis serovar pingluonsis TaxID=180881 RepID=A0A243B0Z9_BACTU|nr:MULTISPECIES: DUF4046 domain-containing protein [Bacillus cereus group]MEB9681939.1 DUF4046 domain-containing protein [Bacillus anthracis]OTY36804.1 hypothetical protein BK742_24080 [Bacillus thuringiensis serovar pingluonsis]
MQIEAITIEEIYQEILDGKRNRFPRNTWNSDENNDMAKRVTRYLVTNILKWNEGEIKLHWGNALIVKYRLHGLLKLKYENSPYAMINDVYPNRFKEWEFKMTPLNFWTKEKALQVLRWIIEEKEKLNQEQLKNIYEKKWLTQLGLRGAVQLYWNDSPYAMINDLYPNQFKEWEFTKTPNNFWTKEKALDALRWTIEEKEKLTDNQLLQKYTMNWLKSHRLWTPLIRYWNGSTYAMINDLYPNKYEKHSFRV